MGSESVAGAVVEMSNNTPTQFIWNSHNPPWGCSSCPHSKGQVHWVLLAVEVLRARTICVIECILTIQWRKPCCSNIQVLSNSSPQPISSVFEFSRPRLHFRILVKYYSGYKWPDVRALPIFKLRSACYRSWHQCSRPHILTASNK